MKKFTHSGRFLPSPATASSTGSGWPLLVALLFVFACSAFPPELKGQSGGKFEIGGDYGYVHANAPPGECGCFSMNGGDAWIGWRFSEHVAGVFQAGAQHASDINGTSADLTLSSFLAGPRITFTAWHRLHPFAQVLLGGAHASGLLTPAVSGASGSATAFAFTGGGGVDLRFSGHVMLRVAEVDYFHTRFDNGGNNHQNNLRVAAGIFLRF